MAAYFVDTSALVKRYVAEVGSAWMTALLGSPSDVRYASRLTAVELLAALARRARGRMMPLQSLTMAVQQFQADAANSLYMLDLPPQVFASAEGLAMQFALRGADALQLATALRVQDIRTRRGLQPITVVSADIELNDAASHLGLLVENPDLHP